MALVNEVLTEALRVAERNLVVRQTTIFNTPTSATSMATPTTSSSPPPATSTNPSGSGNSPASSPLLFFVALGFGVVFTNLWIIVGVKYCFRYNARNRALRAGDDGEPINLENMPSRPHRRRREKKLMSMDEVNERFPLTKYKNWVASRVHEGLPTAGGITAPPSRAGSLREVDIVEPASPVGTKHSVNTRPPSESEEIRASPINDAAVGVQGRKSLTATITEKKEVAIPEDEPKEEHHHLEEIQTSVSTIDNKPVLASAEEEDDEDDHIHDAVPPELLNNPGDSCAICIDTLEEDDDVRGLTCGHAFHAGCLDPWLTSRRACCPLCKADYYTPKPRAEGEPEPEHTSRRSHGRANMPQQPQAAWPSSEIRYTRRSLFPRALFRNDGERSEERQTTSRARAVPAANSTENNATVNRSWRPRISNPFRSFRAPAGETVQQQASPSQLEAGVR